MTGTRRMNQVNHQIRLGAHHAPDIAPGGVFPDYELTSVTTVMSGGFTLASDPNECGIPNEAAWHQCSS